MFTASAYVHFSLIYYFEVVGPGPGTAIPVDILARGTTTGVANAQLGVSFDGGPEGYYVSSPATNGDWTLNTQFTANVGPIYQVSLNAQALPPSGDGMSTLFSSTAAVDPLFTIDPSFANASQYALVFSPGVSNSAAGAVPEPSTWVMLLVGTFCLGPFAIRRAWRTAPV